MPKAYEKLTGAFHGLQLQHPSSLTRISLKPRSTVRWGPSCTRWNRTLCRHHSCRLPFEKSLPTNFVTLEYSYITSSKRSSITVHDNIHSKLSFLYADAGIPSYSESFISLTLPLVVRLPIWEGRDKTSNSFNWWSKNSRFQLDIWKKPVNVMDENYHLMS